MQALRNQIQTGAEKAKKAAARAKRRARKAGLQAQRVGRDLRDRRLLDLATDSLKQLHRKIATESKGKLKLDPTLVLGEKILAKAQSVRQALSRASKKAGRR